jgi:hypothetical protein
LLLDAGFPTSATQVAAGSSNIQKTVTTPGAARLVVAVFTYVNIGGSSIGAPGTVSSPSLTWTKRVGAYFASGTGTGAILAEVWTAPAASVVTGEVITASAPSGSPDLGALTIYCYSGANTSSPAGSTATKTDNSGGSVTRDVSITASASGSAIVACAISPTGTIASGGLRAGNTEDVNASGGGGGTAHVHLTAATASGTGYTMGYSSSSTFVAVAALEILAAPVAVQPPDLAVVAARRPSPRTTDFTIPPAASVFTGTGFASPERAVRAARWLPPPRIEALPPMAVAPPPPPPEAPRALPVRRPMPAPNGDALPPPASVFTGSGFAPPERAVMAPRRLPPPTSDALPPMAAAAPPPPPPEAPRSLPRRGPTAVAYQPPTTPPLPPVVFGPPPPAPLVVRAFRRIRQWISEVGWPAVAAPPPGPSLPPPFTTVVDPVTLSTWVDSVQLTVAVDAVRLSLGERLKPRKTTDTYPITNTLLSNGVAVNLTGYTVTINIVERASRNPKRANGACTLTDAVNGKVSYPVVAGDVDTAGSYDVEWKAVSGGGVPYHFPQDGYEPLEIQPALG